MRNSPRPHGKILRIPASGIGLDGTRSLKRLRPRLDCSRPHRPRPAEAQAQNSSMAGPLFPAASPPATATCVAVWLAIR